jgi:predicted aldo/keto reductase-like oxidoreductase
VPNVKELKDKVLCESYESTYSIHPRENKMYHDLKAIYQRDIAEYVTLCDTCQ